MLINLRSKMNIMDLSPLSDILHQLKKVKEIYNIMINYIFLL